MPIDITSHENASRTSESNTHFKNVSKGIDILANTFSSENLDKQKLEETEAEYLKLSEKLQKVSQIFDE